MGRVFDKVLECTETNDTVVWKDEHQQFAPPLKLIVRDSQVAIFALNGQALDTFGPGKHELDLPQMPLLLAALGLSNEHVNSFRADVYYFNLSEIYGIKWGTQSRVEYVDPKFNIPVSIGARGSFSIAVRQPRTLLVNLLGTATKMTKGDLLDYARSQLQMNIKSSISQSACEHGMCVYDLEMRLPDFSSLVGQRLSPVFSKHGIELTDFVIEDIIMPDDEDFVRFKKAYFETADRNAVYRDGWTEYEPKETTAPVAAQAPSNAQAHGFSHNFCPICGHAFVSDEKYCPECGDKRD